MRRISDHLATLASPIREIRFARTGFLTWTFRDSRSRSFLLVSSPRLPLFHVVEPVLFSANLVISPSGTNPACTTSRSEKTGARLSPTRQFKFPSVAARHHQCWSGEMKSLRYGGRKNIRQLNNRVIFLRMIYAIANIPSPSLPYTQKNMILN